MSDSGAAPGEQLDSSPLEEALRRHGATIVGHRGRWVAAHFGSPAGEAARCRSTVGLADRCERATLELRGSANEVEQALVALADVGEHAQSTMITPGTALVRCDPGDLAACRAALEHAGAACSEVSQRYAAIGLIGPRAQQLLDRLAPAELAEAIVLHDTDESFELLVPRERGIAMYDLLLSAGAPLSVACVGVEALEHLSASHALSHPTPTVR